MSCNAWNHPANCHCGWGGVFYGAGYRDGDDSWHWQRSDSYTVPNASCPRCLARVFFYRSPFGGSVYFDELGPPWPKHPCMDAGSSRTHGPRSSGPTPPPGGRPVGPGQSRRGWRPLICEEVRRHERNDQVVVLKVQSVGGPKRLFALFDRTKLDHRTPFLARTLPNGSFEIATLNAMERVPGEISFIAHASLEGVGQPHREMAKGNQPPEPKHDFDVQPPQPAPMSASAAALLAPRVTTRPRLNRYSPQPVAVTFKRAQTGSVPAAPRTPVNAAIGPQLAEEVKVVAVSNLASATATAPRKRTAPAPDIKKPEQPVRNIDAPLTNMALAFQRLASSDPAIQEVLVSGFRSKKSHK